MAIFIKRCVEYQNSYAAYRDITHKIRFSGSLKAAHDAINAANNEEKCEKANWIVTHEQEV